MSESMTRPAASRPSSSFAIPSYIHGKKSPRTCHTTGLTHTPRLSRCCVVCSSTTGQFCFSSRTLATFSRTAFSRAQRARSQARRLSFACHPLCVCASSSATRCASASFSSLRSAKCLAMASSSASCSTSSKDCSSVFPTTTDRSGCTSRLKSNGWLFWSMCVEASTPVLRGRNGGSSGAGSKSSACVSASAVETVTSFSTK
mmetsp:Transcript_54032/g.107249  ORF Transcript_54032/g.107249 Transcript_54032/m.107249 type:complete len:202 (+) Transcript_54032:627-1232(+)